MLSAASCATPLGPAEGRRSTLVGREQELPPPVAVGDSRDGIVHLRMPTPEDEVWEALTWVFDAIAEENDPMLRALSLPAATFNSGSVSAPLLYGLASRFAPSSRTLTEATRSWLHAHPTPPTATHDEGPPLPVELQWVREQATITVHCDELALPPEPPHPEHLTLTFTGTDSGWKLSHFNEAGRTRD